MIRNPDFARLARSHGIVMDGTMGYIPEHLSYDADMAADAQPSLVTVSNSGIPAFLSTYIDPKMIVALTTPNKAAEILGEVKKGDWTTRTAMFPMVESTGETSSYGDWNNNGSVNANVQFPQRQSYHYQTITQWGEKQMAEAGLAKIDWASQLNLASVAVLNKFQNLTYFFGIAGLQNYGLLNDPSLPAPITPSTKTGVGGGTTWANAGSPNEIYADILRLYGQLTLQTAGLVDMNTKLVLATTPAVDAMLLTANSFNVSVKSLLKANFPNIRFVTAPQYLTTGSGSMVQMIAEEIDGQDTGVCAFTEKLRTHPIILDVSSFKQKKSQGSFGTVIFLPVAFASMLGV